MSSVSSQLVRTVSTVGTISSWNLAPSGITYDGSTVIQLTHWPLPARRLYTYSYTSLQSEDEEDEEE
jgi:hypothetical protein